MARVNVIRIQEILEDKEFVRSVDNVRQAYTKQVMARATTDEERAEALAKAHVLEDVLNDLRSQVLADTAD